MSKIWAFAPGFSAYQVSSTGEVKNDKGLLKPVVNKDGYRQCLLRIAGQRKNVLLHRLIASAFIENPQNLPVINHLDGNKLNNSVDNLEWCTVKHNHGHAVGLGLIKNTGEDNHRHSLKDHQVAEIKAMLAQGLGSRTIANKFGVTRSAIQHIKRGRTRIK